MGPILIIDDLRQARKERGFSQTSLASQIGVHQKAIARLEKGIGSTSLLVRAMDVVGYHVSGLAKGKDLPDQLAKRRLASRISIVELGRRTGLSCNTIRAVESGKGTVASLTKILAAV